MPRRTVTEMRFSEVYPMLVQKAERKGRAKAEVDRAAAWLTGWSEAQIEAALASDVTYGDFFSCAPTWNPNAERITGKVCGVQVEAVEDPLMRRIRQFDKLVDELAKGRAMEKVLRE